MYQKGSKNPMEEHYWIQKIKLEEIYEKNEVKNTGLVFSRQDLQKKENNA